MQRDAMRFDRLEDVTLEGGATEVAGPPDPQTAPPDRYSIDGLRALARAVRDLEETG